MSLILDLLTYSPVVVAAEAIHESTVPTEVPRVVLYQAINLAILMGVLYYFLKDKVRAYYAGKRDSYLKAAREMEELKRKVQEQGQLLQEKIRKLDQTAEQSQKQAQADAQQYSQKLLAEARDQAEKLKRESERTISAEVYRAVEGLRAEIVDQSISSSRDLIQKQIKDSDQKRLQSEFVEKIRVVEN